MDIGHYITKQPLKGNEKLPQIADGSDKRGYSQFYCYAHWYRPKYDYYDTNTVPFPWPSIRMVTGGYT